MAPPTKYTPELEEELINWISSGQTLRAFCRLEGKPTWRSVYTWLENDPEFGARFARARDMGHDAIAEEALQIADTPEEGVRREVGGKDGPKEVFEDMLGHRKLQVETRLKLLAKWNPKKYGDKTEHTVNGPVTLDLKGSDVHG